MNVIGLIYVGEIQTIESDQIRVFSITYHHIIMGVIFSQRTNKQKLHKSCLYSFFSIFFFHRNDFFGNLN
jgi:hypothetical protein